MSAWQQTEKDGAAADATIGNPPIYSEVSSTWSMCEYGNWLTDFGRCAVTTMHTIYMLLLFYLVKSFA